MAETEYRYWTAEDIRGDHDRSAPEADAEPDSADPADAPAAGYRGGSPIIRRFADVVAETREPVAEPAVPAPTPKPAAAPIPDPLPAPVPEPVAEVPANEPVAEIPVADIPVVPRTYVPEPVTEPPAPVPAYRSGYGPAYRTGYLAPPAGQPRSRLPVAPAPRRRRGRRAALVLANLVVIALTAYGAHTYWPKSAPSAGATRAAAVTVFDYTAGHFRAGFDATPTTSVHTETDAGVRSTVHTAADGTVAVAGTDLATTLATARYPVFLSALLHTQAQTPVLSVETATTFRGQVARMGTFSRGGVELVELAFMSTSRRAYVLTAPRARLAGLEASFVQLP